jgi:predicted HD phosphohydrolase
MPKSLLFGKMKTIEDSIRNGGSLQAVPFFWRFARASHTRSHLVSRSAYELRSRDIIKLHASQSLQDVSNLKRKYERPVFGHVTVWSLIEKLAQCIDPSDTNLLAVSQQIHVLQILEEMESDGVTSQEFILAALVHDIGKVLLLTDEAPENIVGMNTPIGEYEEGVGLDYCVMQWNHDEFGYSRLKDHVSDGLAWLIRYHSISLLDCKKYMDARDKEYTERYLIPFARYDHGTKYAHFLPRKRIEEYRHIVEKYFPDPILF